MHKIQKKKEQMFAFNYVSYKEALNEIQQGNTAKYLFFM